MFLLLLPLVSREGVPPSPKENDRAICPTNDDHHAEFYGVLTA